MNGTKPESPMLISLQFLVENGLLQVGYQVAVSLPGWTTQLYMVRIERTAQDKYYFSYRTKAGDLLTSPDCDIAQMVRPWPFMPLFL
jgi:hypothetical protein